MTNFKIHGGPNIPWSSSDAHADVYTCTRKNILTVFAACRSCPTPAGSAWFVSVVVTVTSTSPVSIGWGSPATDDRAEAAWKQARDEACFLAASTSLLLDSF